MFLEKSQFIYFVNLISDQFLIRKIWKTNSHNCLFLHTTSQVDKIPKLNNCQFKMKVSYSINWYLIPR
jgi:hypothetical protein